MKSTRFPVLCSSLLVLFAAVLLFPLVTNSVDATSTSVGVDIDVASAMSIYATSDNITVDVSPNNFETGSVMLMAQTTDPGGFKLILETGGDDNALHREDGTETIPSITTDATADTFPEGAWGYSMDKENFTWIPRKGAHKILDTAESSTTNYYLFTVGAKPDPAKNPSGKYSGTVIFSLVADIEPSEKTLADIETMQEITPQICTNTPEAVDGTGIYQLTDERDRKTYKVARLLDGNCWMVENLKLGGVQPITLTSEKSDVTSDFTLPVSSNQWTAGKIAYDYVDDTYGGFYNWTAATAGTGDSLSQNGATASGSICPKGWKLPHTTNSTDNEFYKMVDPYIKTGVKSITGLSWSDFEIEEALAVPILLTSSGRFDHSSGTLIQQGEFGFWWSSTAASSSNAYRMDLYQSGNIYANFQDVRDKGLSIRCISPGS